MRSITIEDYELFEMIEQLKDTDLKIIIYLFKVGEAPIAKIVADNRMSFATVYRSLKVLHEFKIVGERAEGNKRILFLTEVGKEVASRLLEIDDILRAARESPGSS